MTQKEQEWLPIMEACKQFNISIHIINRLIKEGKLEAKGNILDKRKRLVNVAQLRELLKDA